MKQYLVLAVCVLLVGAMAVQAATISVGTTRESYTSSTSEVLDKLTLTIEGFDGVASGAEISGFEGTWTAVGDGSPALRLTTDAGDQWYDYTLNSFSETMELLGGKWLSSHVNFDSSTGQLGDGSDPSRTATGTADMYSDLTSNWFSLNSFLGVGDVLAVMYVSPGAGVSFDGGMVISGAGGVIIPCNLSTAPVPEPSTLALLVCGLTGLLAYAWRKRK